MGFLINAVTFDMGTLLANKKVLITGGSSALAAELRKRVLAEGGEVICISKSPSDDPPSPGVTQVMADLTNAGAFAVLQQVGPIHLAFILVESPVLVPSSAEMTCLFDLLREQQTLQINALSAVPAAIASAGGGAILFIDSIAASALPEPLKTIAASWNLTSQIAADGWSVQLAALGVKVISVRLPEVSHMLVESGTERSSLEALCVQRASDRVMAATFEDLHTSAAVWLAGGLAGSSFSDAQT